MVWGLWVALASDTLSLSKLTWPQQQSGEEAASQAPLLPILERPKRTMCSSWGRASKALTNISTFRPCDSPFLTEGPQKSTRAATPLGHSAHHPLQLMWP